MESFCSECAQVLRSHLELKLRDHIGSELNGFVVPAQALQAMRNLTFGLDRHGRIGTTMTNRPFQGRLGSLESRIGIELHTFSGATDRPGHPIAQR
jgi:hypothetical protein